MQALAKQVATLAAFAPTPIARAVHAGELQTLYAHAQHISAAVLFADISGFTALTESLAINSPDGSEKLTALLNLYFTHMIVLLESYGGQVVKFSGDAITAIFMVDDTYNMAASSELPYPPEPTLTTATVRASFAAIAMQRAMHEFQRQSTLGSARLGLKVGVGSGDVLAAHVGGVFDRWEYVIAGEAMLQAVHAQEQARRGMVVLSSEAAARVGSPDSHGHVSVVWSSETALSISDDHPLLAYPQPYRVLQHPLDWNWFSPEALQRAQATLRAYVPAAIVSRLHSSEYEWVAELRRMTIMFVGVGGIDYRRNDALNQLQPFIQSVQQTVYRYEGSLNKVMVDDKGTVLLILFGAPPLAHEDDPLRALACAHDLQTSFAQTSSPIRLAIGITNATVFAGPVGSTTRGEYTVMGDAVNLSARLMQQAGAGGTLCDTAIYKEGYRHWSMEELPPLQLKGKANPVQVYYFTGQRLRATNDDETPLVGREQEINRLLQTIDDTQQKQGCVVSLLGEGGIGKTRLITEVIGRMRARGKVQMVLQGVTDSIARQTPYLVWRNVLMDYFELENLHDPTRYRQQVTERARVINPELEQRLPLLNDVLDLELPETGATRGLKPRQRRDSLSFLVVQLLLARARHEALLVVLDDMHWADSLSWELALDVARAAQLCPVFLLLSYRPVESFAEGSTHNGGAFYNAVHQTICALDQHTSLHLLPLENAEIAQLATAALDGSPVAPELVTWLAERSQGNPLFIEETVKMLREHESLCLNGDGRWQFANQHYMQTISPTLKGVIQSRLDRLEPGIQLTCKVASVIGRIFTQRAVAGIYPMREEVRQLEERLSTLDQLDITPLESFKPEVRYQFKSALTQEVAYSSMLHAQRQALHQAIAEWYEREYAADLDPYVPLLADHYSKTEQWGRFIEFAERAGKLAAEHYATQEALHYLSRALAVLTEMPDILPPDERSECLFRLRETRAEVYEYSSNYAPLESDLQELSKLAVHLRDEERQALVQTRWARYYQATNNYDAVEEAARSALAIAQRIGNRRLMGESNNRLARNAQLRGDYHQALWRGFKALGDCRLARDRTGEARSMDFLGIAYTYLGDYAHADDYFQQALAIRRANEDRRGEADSLSRIGNLANILGRANDALKAHREALVIRRSIGDRSGEAESLNNIGSTAQKLGDLSTAHLYLEEARTIWHTLANDHGEAMVLIHLSLIATELGDFETACRHAADSLAITRRLGNRQLEIRAQDILGNAHRGLGHMAEAYQQHTAAYEQAHDLGLPRWEAYARHHLGEWEWTAGNSVAAVAHWAAAAELRAEIGEHEFARASRTRQAHALVHMGRLAEGRALAEEVWTVWGSTPPPGEDEDELREAYLALYETWQQLGEEEYARAALAWAYQAVQDRAIRISDAAQRESFLTRVVVNRDILAAWDAMMKDA